MPNFTEGLVIAVQGILIVFAVLIILMLVLMLFKVIFSKTPNKTEKPAAAPTTPAPAPVQTETVAPEMDQSELIAVIAAAVAAASGHNSTYNLQVRSIRRQGSNSPVWNAVSRKENLESNL